MTLPSHPVDRTQASAIIMTTLTCACLAQLLVCGVACSGPAAPSDSPVGYTEQRRSLGVAGGAALASSAATSSGAANAAGPASAQPSAAMTAQATPSSTAASASGASLASTAPPASAAPAGTAAAAAPASAPAGASPAASSASTAAAPPPAMSAGNAATAAASTETAKPTEAAGSAAGPKATKLKLQFATKSYGGMYQPVNLGAVWVEDASGKWVYTLEMWCGWQNTKSLKPYNAAGGADYSVGLFPGSFTTMPPTDVVTSATLRQHKAHNNGVWSLKDSKGAEVPDGMYKLKLEVTEQEDEGKVLEVPFMKGAAPGPISAPDSPVFTNLKIELQ